jgi:hypothetical protein
MMDEGDVFEMSASAVHSPAAGTRAAAAVASIDRPNGALEADHVERTVRVRLLTVSVLAAILVSLLLAVPGLRLADPRRRTRAGLLRELRRHLP